jgi:hypothetical protein
MTRTGFRPGGLLLLAGLLGAPAFAADVHRCEVDGRPVFQDTPCANDVHVARPVARDHARDAALERRLDELAAQGYGMVQRDAPPPPPAPSAPAEPRVGIGPRLSYAQRQAEWAAQSARIREESERTNAESAARLTRVYEDMRESCGGTVHEKVVVGMSDETFRRCALQARFGNIRQVVVDQDGASPLRLYVFGSGSPSRVYTIDGVVTAVQP